MRCLSEPRSGAKPRIRLRERRPFPHIPLVVVTALGDVDDPGGKRDWAEGHERLARMSPLGSRIELPDALHMVPLDRPDVVADAVGRTGRVEESA